MKLKESVEYRYQAEKNIFGIPIAVSKYHIIRSII